MLNYENRIVVITGASSGLGVQMAKGFASRKATLVIMARREEKLKQVKEMLEEMGSECLAIKCDVTKVEDVNKAAEIVMEKYGKVDVLVNCAGSAKNNGVLNMTDEEWQFTIDTDMNSVFYVT